MSEPRQRPKHQPNLQDEETTAGLYQVRMPSSARRYVSTETQRATPTAVVKVTDHRGQQPAYPRASRAQEVRQEEPRPFIPQREPGRLQKHWRVYLVSGAILMTIGWFLITLMVNWINVTLDDLHYGRPRTYQTDADVGHGGISHFTVENINGQIYIMEIVESDPKKSSLLTGPQLAGGEADLLPVTITFKDVNNDGYPEMIVFVNGQSMETFTNTKDGFKPQNT
jgi:hypothetical protein